MRYTPSGVPVTNFSVAVSRKWKGKDDEPHEKTTWFKVVAWRNLAELCDKYLQKGARVLVEGEVSASAWVGQDGEPRASLELTAQNVRFLSAKGETQGRTPEEPEGLPAGKGDLPF